MLFLSFGDPWIWQFLIVTNLDSISVFRNIPVVPLKRIKYGVYGDLIIICPKPCSMYFEGDYTELDLRPGKERRVRRNAAGPQASLTFLSVRGYSPP